MSMLMRYPGITCNRIPSNSTHFTGEYFSLGAKPK